jgi:hypothetical protein
MNLAQLRPSFASLSEHDQHELIMDIRLRRRNALLAVKSRQTRAAKSPSTPRNLKQANSAINNLSPEQALQMLALIGDIDEQE